MTIQSLVKRIKGGREDLPVRRGAYDPFRGFQRDMNSLFEDFLGEFPIEKYGMGRDLAASNFSPLMDVSENDKEVLISAELPGMEEKDITVEIEDSVMTIRGEKKEEHEEKGRNWYRREQSYGSFNRSIILPADVDDKKAKAQFKKGVLTVTVPKTEEKHEKRKTIAIET